jgi:hypothetical protein
VHLVAIPLLKQSLDDGWTLELVLELRHDQAKDSMESVQLCLVELNQDYQVMCQVLRSYDISQLLFHNFDSVLTQLIKTQLEYYFDSNNLQNDVFLRTRMDSQGFVLADIVLHFRGVMQFTKIRSTFINACINACKVSDLVECAHGKSSQPRLRRRTGWQEYVLPKEQRDLSMRIGEADTIHTPERSSEDFERPV